MGINEKEDTTMKIMTNIKTLAALLMAGAAFTACSSSDEIIEQPANPTAPQVYTLVIKASKGGDATTRALKLTGEGDKTLSAYWSGNETIEVEQGGVNIGYATAAASPNGETTLTATLSPAPDPTKDLNFYLCGSNYDYTGQVGLLTGTNSISEKYDYAMDCLTDNSYIVNGSNVTPKSDGRTLNFGAVQQAIIKFTLKNSDGSALPSNPTAFTVTDGAETVGLTSIPASTYTANGDGVLYVAFPAAGSAKTINLTATVGSDTYTYTTSETKTFALGKYYEITVKMTKQAAVGHALSSAVVGEVVGSDGLAYAGASYNNLPTGVTAVAKVCYVDGNGHGLALALVDMSTSLSWDNSGLNNDGKTAAEWCSAWNTSTPVTDAEWLLASKDQWNYMLGTSGAGSYTALRDGFTSVGGSDLKSSQYWSSTESEDDPRYAWTIAFGSGSWGARSKIGRVLVRACLTF